MTPRLQTVESHFDLVPPDEWIVGANPTRVAAVQMRSNGTISPGWVRALIEQSAGMVFLYGDEYGFNGIRNRQKSNGIFRRRGLRLHSTRGYRFGQPGTFVWVEVDPDAVRQPQATDKMVYAFDARDVVEGLRAWIAARRNTVTLRDIEEHLNSLVEEPEQ